MVLWVLISGFFIGFGLAFSIGANDVANAFGTSVGSKVLTLYKACVLASLFETAGAVLLGSKVSSTISKGIIDNTMYDDDIFTLELGYLASLVGAFIWLMVATMLKLPVSGTHSIVGAVLGFTLVAKGPDGVNWLVLLKIVASWFISPMMSGIISAGIYYALMISFLTIKDHKVQVERALLLLPFIYAITLFINTFSILFDAPPILQLDTIPWWVSLIVSIAIGALSALVVRVVVAPMLKRKIIDRRGTLKELYEVEETASDDAIPLAKYRYSNEMDQIEGSVEKSTSISIDRFDSTSIVKADRSTSMSSWKRAVDRTTSFHSSEFVRRSNSTSSNASSTSSKASSNTSAVSHVTTVIDRSEFDVVVAHSEDAPAFALALKTPFKAPDSGVDSNDDVVMPEYSMAETHELEYPGIYQIFAFLQILTACFTAFAHGGNDVSNAVGPVIGLYDLYQGKELAAETEPELWILALGGAGITMGLWMLGRRVIETVGTDLTEVTPPSGFSIELGAAVTVLIASHAYVPVSTTHCKIGSVVITGLIRGGRTQVNWKIFRNILLAWAVTVPASLTGSAVTMLLLTLIYPDRTSTLDSYVNSSNWTNSSTTSVLLTSLDTSIFL